MRGERYRVLPESLARDCDAANHVEDGAHASVNSERAVKNDVVLQRLLLAVEEVVARGRCLPYERLDRGADRPRDREADVDRVDEVEHEMLEAFRREDAWRVRRSAPDLLVSYWYLAGI